MAAAGSAGARSLTARVTITPPRVGPYVSTVLDTGLGEQLVGKPEPAAVDHERVLAPPPVPHCPPVPDPEDTVSDLSGRRIMAHNDDARAIAPREFDDQRAGDVGAGVVEFPGWLVGEQQRRPVGERGAQCKPLALAAG